MTTARDIITKALQKNGVLTSNDGLSGDEVVDGLFNLNAMLESWANDSLLCYATVLESFDLVSGQADYTIGTGGDFDTARPMKILSAFIRQGETDYPLSIVNAVDYDNLAEYKEITTGIPEAITLNGGFPLNTITFYYVPSGGLKFFLRSEKYLTNIPTLDTVIQFPVGWVKALIDNLAIEEAPNYGQPLTESLVMSANKSIGAIKRNTTRNRPLDAYPVVSNKVFDVFSGGY